MLRLLPLIGWLVLWSSSVVSAATWLRIEAPRCVVYTDGPVREAEAWVRTFHEYCAGLERVVRRSPAPLPKLTVVIFSHHTGFSAYQPRRAGRTVDVGGFFSVMDERAVIGLDDQDSDQITTRVIQHEAFHWYMSGSTPRLPIWLEEGLAEVFSTFRVEDGEAVWGEHRLNHAQLLHDRPRLGMAEFLAKPRSEWREAEQRKAGLLYAQAWATAHYMLFGKKDGVQADLGAYLTALGESKPAEEALRAGFGDMKDLDLAIGRYVSRGKYTVRRAPIGVPVGMTFPSRPAEEGEWREALGYLALAAGRIDLALEHSQAVQTLRPESPAGWEMQMRILVRLDEELKALPIVEEAEKRGSTDFRITYLPAYVMLLRADERAEKGQPLGAREARLIANQFERSINRFAAHDRSYIHLARVLELAEPLKEQDKAFLEQGHALFPDDARIQMGLAMVAKRQGQTAQAIAWLRTLLALEAPWAASKSRAESLLAEWSQPTK